jgi:hypothetical protein
VQYLSSPHVSRIVVIGNGKIVEEGAYAELMRPGTAFKALVDAQQSKSSDSADVTEEPDLAQLEEIVEAVEEALGPSSVPVSVSEVGVDVPATLGGAPAPITKRRASTQSDMGSPTAGEPGCALAPGVV